MNFALFLLLNVVLLIRPEELFPDGPGLHLYLIVIVLCVATSLPSLLAVLSPASLRKRPIAVCILLFYAFTFVSQFAHGQISNALFEFGPELGKVVLYYFLLISVVNTETRFRVFIAALVVLICSLTAIALAHHYDVVHFPTILPCVENVLDPATGELTPLSRLVSSGIFHDPNDLCLMLGLGIVCCMYCSGTTRWGVVGAIVWLVPIPLFIYALLETHSRGGLLGVLAGAGAYLYSRYGGAKALPFVFAAAVGAIALVGGRQASIAGTGTGHQRVMAWAEGFTQFYRHPVYIPIGLGNDWFRDETGNVAHNSFVEAYVDFGLFGGGAFLAAFYLGARVLERFGRGIEAPRWAIAARHFGFAALIGYAVGCYSLTRNFVIPTYLVLGLVSVLFEQSRLPKRYQVDGRWFVWFGIFSSCGLILITLATQILGRAGV